MLRKINHMVSRIIRRVTTSLPNNDSGFVQTTQVSYQGGASTTEVMSPYGYSYSAPVGSLGFMFNNLGNMDDRMALCYHPRTRFKNLKDGEIEIGNQLKKTSIKFDADGNIIITADKDVNVILNGTVNLGVGGSNIARVGDGVEVTINSGSSAGTWQGTITSGGMNTST